MFFRTREGNVVRRLVVPLGAGILGACPEAASYRVRKSPTLSAPVSLAWAKTS